MKDKNCHACEKTRHFSNLCISVNAKIPQIPFIICKWFIRWWFCTYHGHILFLPNTPCQIEPIKCKGLNRLKQFHQCLSQLALLHMFCQIKINIYLHFCKSLGYWTLSLAYRYHSRSANLSQVWYWCCLSVSLYLDHQKSIKYQMSQIIS